MSEQAVFLPKRQIKDNLRAVIDMIEYYDKHIDKEAVFFVDGEKAFDNINWDFLLMLIEKMELEVFCTQVIKAIYKDQKAMLIINTDKTQDLRLRREQDKVAHYLRYYL